MGTRMLPKPNLDGKGGHAEGADVQATVTQITGTEIVFFFFFLDWRTQVATPAVWEEQRLNRTRLFAQSQL